MTKITQLKGRSGFYLVVPVPSKLRKVIRSSNITKKAGATKAEALRNRAGLLMEIEQRFRVANANDPVLTTFAQVKPGDDQFQEVLEGNLKAAGYDDEQITAALHGEAAAKAQGVAAKANSKLEAKLNAAVNETQSWQQWIERREIEELPSAATVANWKSRLTLLSRWMGTDYLAGLTKQDAVNYKGMPPSRNTHQTVRTSINCLKAFWNYAKDHGQVSENVWDGLTKKLAPSPKKEAIPADVMQAARYKSDEMQDVRFWIQTYTGCRKGEHGGLRWCDIDTAQQVIHFKQWRADGRVRRLKGNTKDERTVPISSKLLDKLRAYLPKAFTNNTTDPIWSDDYKPCLEAWSARWAERFSYSYGFSSHNLRSYVVSQLMGQRFSVFHLYEVTRHKVPGMSDVVSGYVRPTMDELREIVESLN